MMMGMLVVACWAARTPGVLPMMISTSMQLAEVGSVGHQEPRLSE